MKWKGRVNKVENTLVQISYFNKFIFLLVYWTPGCIHTFHSSVGRPWQPWIHQHHTDQKDTHVADDGSFRFHQPATVVIMTLQKPRHSMSKVRLQDFSCNSYLVIFQDCKLDLLLLVLDLLGSRVVLLLALLCTSQQSQSKVKGRFFLYIII